MAYLLSSRPCSVWQHDIPLVERCNHSSSQAKGQHYNGLIKASFAVYYLGLICPELAMAFPFRRVDLNEQPSEHFCNEQQMPWLLGDKR